MFKEWKHHPFLQESFIFRIFGQIFLQHYNKIWVKADESLIYYFKNPLYLHKSHRTLLLYWSMRIDEYQLLVLNLLHSRPTASRYSDAACWPLFLSRHVCAIWLWYAGDSKPINHACNSIQRVFKILRCSEVLIAGGVISLCINIHQVPIGTVRVKISSPRTMISFNQCDVNSFKVVN